MQSSQCIYLQLWAKVTVADFDILHTNTKNETGVSLMHIVHFTNARNHIVNDAMFRSEAETVEKVWRAEGKAH